MKNKLIYYLIFIGIFSNLSIFSQNKSTEDTVENINKKDFLVRPFKKNDYFNTDFFNQPSLTIYTGFNLPTYSKINPNPKFNTMNFATIELGSTRITSKELKSGDKINETMRTGLFLSNFSSKWRIKDNANLNAKMWRFGITLNDKGYGYKMGSKNYLFLTHGTSLIWSKFDVDGLNNFSQPDSTLLGAFSSQFRFGNSFQSGFSFVALNSISLDFRYERSLIYPAHKFWYWLGSYFLEGISQELLNKFIKEAVNSSPKAGPIVNAILKGALSYGIYELRKDQMNWPFKTEPPLFNDNFKIGLTFIF